MGCSASSIIRMNKLWSRKGFDDMYSLFIIVFSFLFLQVANPDNTNAKIIFATLTDAISSR